MNNKNNVIMPFGIFSKNIILVTKNEARQIIKILGKLPKRCIINEFKSSLPIKKDKNNIQEFDPNECGI